MARDRETLSPPLESAVDPEENALAEKLRLYQDRQVDGALPESRTGIEARLNELENIRQYAVSAAGEGAESPLVQQLDGEIEKLRTTLQFESLIQEGDDLLSLAASQKSPTASSYCLQLGETALRQVLILKDRLDESRQDKADRLLQRLREQSESVAKREAENVWCSFETEATAELEEVRSWSGPSPTGSDKACQQQLDRIRHLVEKLQTVLPRLSHTDVSRKALERLTELNRLAVTASVAQQKRYNEWPLERIRVCLSRGLAHVGTITSLLDDPKCIGQTIVHELGPVDTRLLTMEVQRCYQEVFEHLLGKLKNPSSSDDFKTDGCKLKVLDEMFNERKRELSDF